MTIRIRKARVDDTARLADLWHEMATFHARRGAYWRVRRGCKRGFEEHIAKTIRAGEAGVFVAHDRGALVGFAVGAIASRARCFVEKDHGLIGDIAVTADYRGRGIGEKLCRRVIRWFTAHGLETAEVRVATANPVSTAFWAKMGFEPYMVVNKKRS